MTRAAPVFALLLFSCSTPAQLDRRSVIDSAVRYTEARLPEARFYKTDPLVVDDGKDWRVTFKGPADAVGGGAVVWVSKKTGKAVRVLGLQ